MIALAIALPLFLLFIMGACINSGRADAPQDTLDDCSEWRGSVGAGFSFHDQTNSREAQHDHG